MSINKMYFSLAPKKCDVSVILETKPKNILVSYGLWGNQNGKYKLGKIIESFWTNGYYPNVMLDSGAYTFIGDVENESFLSIINPMVSDVYYNCYELSKEFDSYDECLAYHVNLIANDEIHHYYEDVDKGLQLLSKFPKLLSYIEFIEINKKYIDYIIALDVIKDAKLSMDNWIVIKSIFSNAIPTFHYDEDFDVLDFYAKNGAKYISLGGLVFAKKQGVKAKTIIDWINECCNKYPDLKFHVFGCQDFRKLNKTTAYSADGASWIISAGKNCKKIGKTKFQLACEIVKAKDI